ncbi:SusC/RagA family TonB-linked outer membrane protein [Pedobacter sp. SL55]|uniref:SusC/RagA family TonB-linked outer membrane protein n=1 Tax=Pedobacter sp. SL55 TaxID=2995161 RepID=UPI002271B9A6|nr:TonB-dependent receptor [Pedobacter sp. SL55]WAC40537.1 TonB-dependent receptor [Pedobacter sp. SL55]
MTLKNCASSVVFLLLCLFSVGLSAQTVKIKGVVKSEDGQGIPGVSVVVKDTNKGVSTNEKGEYEISVQKGKILEFKSLGYKTHLQGVANATTINVTLVDDVSAMNEVIVVGYGTQKKSTVSSAVSKLENKNLDEIPTSRLDNALIGKIAGLTVQNNTSEAGADPTLRVRGASSINANADPLVVVDGHPIADGLAFINPYDVESIEVLKDAASSAIYGSRGANGVILVTTKKGVADKPKFSVKSFYGIKEAYEVYPILTTSQYTELLFAEAKLRENDPSVPAASKNLINANERAAYIIENQISGSPTDWQQESLRNAGIYNLQLNVAGGKKDMRYYVSGNLQQDQGVMKDSENNKGNVRVKLDINLSPKLMLNVNINPTYTKIQRPSENFTNYYRFPSFLPVFHSAFTSAFVNQNAQWSNIRSGDWAQARHFTNLNYAGTMPDGTFWQSTGAVSPFSSTNNTPLSHAEREDRFQESYRFQSGTDLTYNPNKNLSFKSSVGAYYLSREDRNFIRSEARKDGDVNQATITTGTTVDILWENTMNYKKNFGNHNFTGLLGFTLQSNSVKGSQQIGYNFPSDDFSTLNQAAYFDQAPAIPVNVKTGLVSYLGRVNYDYKGKYIATASLRTDESSIFGPGNRRGWFPAFSAGWNIASESFMKGSKKWLENLKIRASYGETGNNRITPFSYLDLLFRSNYVFGEGTGQVSPGQSPNNLVTFGPNITWETTKSTNIGLDVGLFRNKIQLSLEYYHSITDKLLLQQAQQAITGSDSFWTNNGKIRNQGFEIEFTSNNIGTKNFNWTTSLNVAANRNKLLKLGGNEPYLLNYGERSEIYASIVGQPYVQFFGYKTDGVWISQDEADAAVAGGQTSILQGYFAAGGVKLKDINGDNKIDLSDRVIMGNPFPDFTWGLTNTIRYKKFDLNILMQGSQGGQLINGDLFYNESKRQNERYIKDRWVSPANPGDGKTPYFTNGIAADLLLTDYGVESATYAYLRNIIVGYTLPAKALKKFNVSSLRLYASVDNVFFITGSSYRGINPEARLTTASYASPVVAGYQRGGFPVNRTYTFGLDFNF